MTESDTRDTSEVTLGRDAYPGGGSETDTEKTRPDDGRPDDGRPDDGRPEPGAGAPRPQPGPAARRTHFHVPTFDLSLTQLVATGLAAVTATVAASYLGVAGTVIGAAVASVLSAVGNAVYSTSLRTTRDRVREVVPVTLLRTGATASLATRPATGGGRAHEPPTLPAGRPGPAPDPAPAPPGHRILWKRVALIAATMFLTVLAVVTGIELAAGRPLADVLRGNAGSGTSVFGGTTVKTRTVPPTAPTVYVTVTPHVVVTTPTYTRTASPATTTTTPSGAATSPSAPPSTSGAPSSSGSPTP